MKNKRRKLIMLLIILTIGLIVTRGFSYARYASNAVFNYYLGSKGFYFDSKDLTFDTKKHVDTMWDGDKVYFSLTNSANDALASEVDIKYEVKCTVNEDDTTKKCLINGTDSDTMEATLSVIYGCSDGTNVTQELCVSNGKDWVSKPAEANLYFEVVDVEENDVLSADVTVTVTSLKPYKKVLSAEYSLIKDNTSLGDLALTYEKVGVKSNLIVTNSFNEDKCVYVSWDTKDFSFDDSGEYLGVTTDENDKISGLYFNISKMNSKTFGFYGKDNDTNYNELYFKLVESNLCQ